MKGWPGEPDMEYDVLEASDAASTAQGQPIKDVIFDFGNVLISWNPEAALISRYSQDTIDQFLDDEISGFYSANDSMDEGMSLEGGVAQVRAAHGDRWANIMQYYVDNFQDTLLGNIPGMRVLVEDLKTAGIGVWGLSNWNRELYPLAEQYCDVLTHLDGKIVSAFVGLRKPHRDIYERALHDFDIDAATSIFVDDKSMNILGANQAGIRGVRFSDSRKLRGLLIEQGIDIPAVK